MNKYNLTLLSLIIGLLSITLVMAWPYQLNLSNGVLYDTNASNNATTNFTIYVVNQTYILNNTINQTIYLNQTLVNYTCINCTNYTNYTYVYHYNINGTNNSFYNTTDADLKFVTNAEFTNYKNSIVTTVPRAEFDNLVARVNNITILPENNSHGGLWGGIIIGWLLTAVAIFFVIKSSGGVYESLS